MSSGGDALIAVTIGELRRIDGLNGVHEGRPVQAAFPYATVEAGSETDWSHKTAQGREVRLTVTVRDAGERPERLRKLMAAIEARMDGLNDQAGAWRIVTCSFLRNQVFAAASAKWAGVIDYRVRMLATPDS